MLKVNFNNVIGEFKTNTNKYIICTANALCAIVTKGKAHYLYTFFNDRLHAEKCLGLKKDWAGNKINCFEEDNWQGVKLNMYFKEAKTLAELLTKAGYNVKIYYKKPKGVK